MRDDAPVCAWENIEECEPIDDGVVQWAGIDRSNCIACIDMGVGVIETKQEGATTADDRSPARRILRTAHCCCCLDIEQMNQ